MAAGDDDAAVARLRANAAHAGIRLGKEDVARISAGAYFRNVEALRQLVARMPSDLLPDYVRESLQVERDGVSGAA